MPSPLHILYFNGLGSGATRKRERLAITYLAKHGIEVVHVPINWYQETFEPLLKRTTNLTQQHLRRYGKLVLVGSSAGGSLVVSIISQLHDPNLYGITLCSRLREAPLPWWDTRTLARMAHLGSAQPSQAFFDSVTYCGSHAVPALTLADKQRLVLVRQWADFVVPRPTMSIPGVAGYTVPALGHGWGIAMGARRLPQVVKALEDGALEPHPSGS